MGQNPGMKNDRCYCYTRHKNTQDVAYVSDSAAAMFSEFFRGLKAKKMEQNSCPVHAWTTYMVHARMLLAAQQGNNNGDMEVTRSTEPTVLVS
jgi:hypothetical protein